MPILAAIGVNSGIDFYGLVYGVIPFLRWVGGKRWLSRKLSPLIRGRLNGTYFEPFLGAGAVFLELKPDHAVLSDVNADLINTFKMVGKNALAITEKLMQIPVNPFSYYAVRESNPSNRLSKAVRFIFLNRTCFAGIYRTNAAGQFNTPYGGGSRTPDILWKKSLLHEAGNILKRKSIKLHSSDFEELIESSGEGDVIYCDPVYASHDRKEFDRYNSIIFDWTDQLRLKSAAFRALKRGALVIISNSYSFDIKTLYREAYRIPVQRRNKFCPKNSDRVDGLEYLIILDPLGCRRDWTELGPIERTARAKVATFAFKKDESNDALAA